MGDEIFDSCHKWEKSRGEEWGMLICVICFVIIFPKCHFCDSYSDKEPSPPCLLLFLSSFISYLTPFSHTFRSRSPTFNYQHLLGP